MMASSTVSTFVSPIGSSLIGDDKSCECTSQKFERPSLPVKLAQSRNNVDITIVTSLKTILLLSHLYRDNIYQVTVSV